MNKDKRKAYLKAYYKANREKLLNRAKAYREANKEERKLYEKAYREANKQKISDYKKAYREFNKAEITKRDVAYRIQRRKSDSFFRLISNYRRSCIRAFKSIGQKKNTQSLKLLGLKTWQELAKHLEPQFYDHPKTGEKMTFDNHGFYGWHIDHIVPLSTAKTEEDIIKLCHYTNLQPLWAEENLSKSSKILDK